MYFWTRKTLGQKTYTILMRRRRIHVLDQHHSNQHAVRLGFPSYTAASQDP